MKLERTIEQWNGCDPEAMAFHMSEAAIMFAFKDAKADILALHAEITRLRSDLALAQGQRDASEQREQWLRNELEREQIRLAACGVVALANTPDSAKEARQMHEDYWSASVADVARMVDEQMRLRDENAGLREDQDESDALRTKLADILTRTANELKGYPGPLSLHSWHDLPECAQNLRKDVARWRDYAAMQKGE